MNRRGFWGGLAAAIGAVMTALVGSEVDPEIEDATNRPAASFPEGTVLLAVRPNDDPERMNFRAWGCELHPVRPSLWMGRSPGVMYQDGEFKSGWHYVRPAVIAKGGMESWFVIGDQFKPFPGDTPWVAKL